MSITELNSSEQYDRFVQQNQNILIFFGMHSCGHCVQAQRFVQEIAQDYPELAVAHVEVSKVKVKGLTGVPAFLLYRDGQITGSQMGADEDGLYQLVEENLGLASVWI